MHSMRNAVMAHPKRVGVVAIVCLVLVAITTLSLVIVFKDKLISKEEEMLNKNESKPLAHIVNNTELLGEMETIKALVSAMQSKLLFAHNSLGSSMQGYFKDDFEPTGTWHFERARPMEGIPLNSFGLLGHYTRRGSEELSEMQSSFMRPICTKSNCYTYVDRFPFGQLGNFDRMATRKSCLHELDAENFQRPVFCTANQFSSSIAASSVRPSSLFVLAFHGHSAGGRGGPTGSLTRYRESDGRKLCQFHLHAEDYYRWTDEGQGVCDQGKCAFMVTTRSGGVSTSKVIALVFNEDDCTYSHNIIPSNDDCPGRPEDECSLFWADKDYWGCVSRPFLGMVPKIIQCKGGLEGTCVTKIMHSNVPLTPQGIDPHNVPAIANGGWCNTPNTQQRQRIGSLAMTNPNGGYTLVLSTTSYTEQNEAAYRAVRRREGMMIHIFQDPLGDYNFRPATQRKILPLGGEGTNPGGDHTWKGPTYTYPFFDGIGICVMSTYGVIMPTDGNQRADFSMISMCQSDLPFMQLGDIENVDYN